MAIVPVGDYAAHVGLWTEMLRTFVGWQHEQVLRWAERFKPAMEDENSWFYHEPPEFYVASMMSTNRLRSTLQAVRFRECEIEVQNILKNELESAATIEDIDWRSAKVEIDATLRKYGESLANVAAEIEDRYRQ